MSRKISTHYSLIHGKGVFALKPIKKGERIIEYKGLVRTHKEVDNGDLHTPESGHTFLFKLNNKYVVDASINGNSARWINHGCEPNCEAVIQRAANKKPECDKIFIEAICDIEVGDELVMNYGIVLDEFHSDELKQIWACECGSPKCTGTLLQEQD